MALAPASRSRLRVLVVDDDEDNAAILMSAVEVWGHEAFVARDGMQGIRAAEATKPDVILLDYAMPVMTGAQVVRALASRPDLRAVPVILVTAYDDPRLEGVAGYLQKPVSLDALEALLRVFADEPVAARRVAGQLGHPCPFCGARPGEWCRLGARPADRLHAGRPDQRGAAASG